LTPGHEEQDQARPDPLFGLCGDLGAATGKIDR
jgi:hypothetical protein